MRRLARAVVVAVALASAVVVATGESPAQPDVGSAPRVVNLFYNDAVGNPLPPPAIAAVAAPTVIEDAKAAAVRIAQSAIPALVTSGGGSSDRPTVDIEWWPTSSFTDGNGLSHTRLQQRIGGLRVFGAEVIVHLDAVNNVAGLNGEVVADFEPDALKPLLGFDAAVKAARLHLAAEIPGLAFEGPGISDRLAVESGELLIYNAAVLDAGPSANHVAYHVIFSSPDRDQSYTALVDARSGKLLTSFNNIESAKSRAVHDLSGGLLLPGPQCHNETAPVGAASPDCVSAHRFSGETYDFFQRVFARDGFDGAGGTMRASVRYGTIGNAFWNGQQTAFGPGFATKDVVAHEWTHALVSSTARLVYLNQSGALNESIADIIASMIDVDADWLIGEDLARGAIRSLADPTVFGHPGKVSDSQFVCSAQDNGGVHSNSGVPNHAAYLMAQGGTYNGRGVTAIGGTNALARDNTAKIFYRALTNYLTAGSSFADAYTALRTSCADLFGGLGSATCQSVTSALDAVEMDQPACGGAAATPDPFEVDDTAASSSTLTTPQVHTFHDAGDADWVRVTVTAGSSMRFETTALQSQADTVLRLYGPNGTSILAEDDDGGGALASRLDYTFVSAGTYYLRVVHYNPAVSGATTGYTLQMTSVTNSGDSFEPDNSSTAATVITPNGAAQLHHTFGTAGDVDFARFTATAGSIYVIQTENLLPQSDPYLFLYDTDGTTLLASDDDGGGRLSARVVWAAPASGTYFIKLRAYDQAVFGPNTGYDLRVLTTTTAPDSFEPDDLPSQAHALALNVTESHDFHAPSDYDWVRFAATSGSTYAIATLSLQPRADTVLDLVNAAGTVLATNDDTAGGLASLIVHTAAASGDLFVRVRQYDPRAFGASTGYALRITSSACVGADGNEPNNTISQATLYPATDGTPQSHNHACPGDVDHIRFNAVRNMDYDIRTLGLGSGSDTVMALLDSSGTVLGFDDDGGGGQASRILWRAVTDGTFYVQTRQYSPVAIGPTTSYQVAIVGSGTSAIADVHEADNTQAAAKALIFAAPHTGSTSHNFHGTGDHDWVVVTGLGPGVPYAIETFNLGSYADTVVEVYDGPTLLTSDDDGGGGLASRALFNGPPSGSVTAKIFHYSPSQFGANTNYDVRARSASHPTNGDAYETDDTSPQSSVLPIGGGTIHDFHDAGDIDWARFTATAGNTYTIFTTNLGPASDTVMQLWGTNATVLLAANDDGGGGLASRIVFTPSASATYHVRINHFNAASVGPDTTYELRLTEATAAGGDAFEIDNIASQAVAIAIGGTQSNHNFHVPGDLDWVSFPATAGDSYLIETFGLGAASDTVIDLYAPNATTILRTNDDDGSSQASRIQWTAPSTGTYYVRVSHFSPSASGPTTTYSLRILAVAGCSGPFEPDNSPAQATSPLGVGVVRDLDFQCEGDLDWVRLTNLTPGVRYGVDTSNLGTGTDTVLTLFNETASAQIAENDDFGGTQRSHVEFIAGARWQALPVMPIAVIEAAVGAINGVIYVAGGHSNSGEVDTVQAFDAQSNSWSYRSQSPQYQTGSVSAVHNGMLYSAGIWGPSDLLRRYDPATDSWTTLSPLQVPRSDAAGAIINGVFYVAGGRAVIGEEWSTEGYDIALDQWNTYANMPARRSYAAFGAINGQLYVAGGIAPGGSDTNTLFRFNPATNSWATLAPMPGGTRSYAAGAVVDGKFYVIGGLVNSTESASVLMYDPATNTWTSVAPLEIGRWKSTAVVVGNRVYVVGGILAGETNWTNRVDSFLADGTPGTGDYWVRARQYNPLAFGVTSTYALELTALSSSAADVHEPDGTTGTAKALLVGTPHTGATSHNFHLANDEDWFYFDAPANRCFFQTFGLGSRADTVIELYDPSGTSQLGYDDDSGGWPASLLGHTFSTPARHLLKVYHYNQTIGGPETQYSIKVRCGDDAFEPDNDSDTPNVLAIGVSQRHIFGAPGDEDWAQFNAVSGTSYVIETLNLDPGNDTYLYLVDTDGAGILLENDDVDGYQYSRIVWVAPSTGIYYAKVRHYQHPYAFGPDTGYDLRVREGTSEANPPIARVSVVAGDGSGRVQFRVRPLHSADAIKVQVFAKPELLSFAGAESLIAGKNGETHGVVRLLQSPAHEPVISGAYLDGKQLAQTIVGNEALALNFYLPRALPGGKTRAVVRVMLMNESGDVTVADIPTVVAAADAQPRINAVVPQAVATETGGTFTVHGSNFVITPKVFLVNNGSPLELRDVRIGLDGTWIEATVPAGTKIGAFKVRVQNPDGAFSDSADDLYVTRGGGACDFTLSQDSVVVSGAGGQVAVNVTTGAACVWVPQPGVSWVRVNSPNEASGTGQASFTVNSSTSGAARSGVVTIGSRTLTVVQPANRNPSMSAIANQSITQGTSTGPLSFTVTDDDDDSVTVTGSSSNQALVPNSNIVFGGGVAGIGIDGLYATVNRTVTVTPISSGTGNVTITLSASDGRTGTATTSFQLQVDPPGNRSPVLSAIASQSITRDTSTGAIAFTVSDPDGDAVTVRGASSNQSLVPHANVVIAGTGTNRTVTVTPLAGQTGSTVITLDADDGRGGSASTTFQVQVTTPGNQSPVLSAIANQSITRGTTTGQLGFTVTDADGDVVTVTGSSSNVGLIPLANVVIAGSGTSRTVTVTPVPDLPPPGTTASSVITLDATDGRGGSASASFVVEVVAPANRPPVLSSIANQNILQDTTTGPLPFTVSDPDGDPVTVTAASSNQAVVPNGNLTLGGSGVNRSITVAPAAGATGATTITITATDGIGGSANTGFTVNVDPLGSVGVPRDVRVDVTGRIIDVQWLPPTVGESPTSYRVEARTPGSADLTATTTSTRLTLNLTSGPRGTWGVRVIGIRDGRESRPSDEVVVVVGAPTAPLNLTRSVTGSIVTLSWSPPESADADSYILRAGSSPGASNLATVPLTGTTFVSPPVPDGTYYVRVFAQNAIGVSPASNEVIVVVGAATEPPGAPGNLQHTVTGSTVAFTWQAAAGGAAPTHYELHAGTATGLSNIVIAPVGNVVTFTASGVPDGTYFVRVYAVNAAGRSAQPSNEVTVVVGTPVLAPGSPSALNIVVAGNQVIAVWVPPTTGGPVDTYVIDAGTGPGLSNIAQVAIGSAPAFSASGVPPGTYFVRVRAVNRGGSSLPSNEVRIVVP